MRRIAIAVCVVGLVAGACGGGDSGDGAVNGGSGNGDLDFDLLGFDTSFDTGDLPDDFPAEYAPSDIVAGQVAQIGEITTVSFYTEMSFDQALGLYEPLLGTPILVGGPGDRVATWVEPDDWAGSLLEEDPLLVTFTEVPG